MTQILPYLYFDGLCNEAMHFYQKCLGGNLQLQKLGESPMAAQLPSIADAQILHSTLQNDKMILMASDMIHQKHVRGNSIILCLNCSSESEMYEIFANLSQGGVVRLPIHQNFRGSTYGELTDQFGIQWILNYQRQ
jgi:PhnB protein